MYKEQLKVYRKIVLVRDEASDTVVWSYWAILHSRMHWRIAKAIIAFVCVLHKSSNVKVFTNTHKWSLRCCGYRCWPHETIIANVSSGLPLKLGTECCICLCVCACVLQSNTTFDGALALHAI